VILIENDAEQPEMAAPKPPPILEFRFYEPEFHAEVQEDKKMCLESKEHCLLAQKFLSKDVEWLTPELHDKIHMYFPKPKDKSPTGERNIESLKEHTMILFAPGRKWASTQQLVEALQCFSSSWGAHMSHTGGGLICSYGNSKAKKHVKHIDPNKRRTVSVSLKETVNCPFKIPHGFKDCGVNSKKNVPRILYQCVVGQAGCYVHTCGCSPATQRAIMPTIGTLIPDVAGLTSVISVG